MATLGRLIWLVVLRPLAYAYLLIVAFIDTAAYWLDTVFHTHLRTPKITTEEVEDMINMHLPVGSNSEAILTFLEQHKIGHSDEFLGAVYYDLHPFKNNPKLSRKKAVIKKCGQAWLHNVGRSLLVRDDIYITFYLDDQNTLVEYVVEYVGTGL